MRLIALLLVFISVNANAVSFAFNASKDIYAIGSLPISGAYYDISFDGAFGTTDVTQLGLDPLASAHQIANYFNYLGDHSDPRLRFAFPTVANKSTRIIQVIDSDASVYTSFYGAGWVCCVTHFDFDADLLVYFRTAIPNSIENTPFPPSPVPIPEPEIYAMFVSGLFVTFAAARRKRIIPAAGAK